jgi:hypothetical protein
MRGNASEGMHGESFPHRCKRRRKKSVDAMMSRALHPSFPLQSTEGCSGKALFPEQSELRDFLAGLLDNRRLTNINIVASAEDSIHTKLRR